MKLNPQHVFPRTGDMVDLGPKGWCKVLSAQWTSEGSHIVSGTIKVEDREGNVFETDMKDASAIEREVEV